MRALSVFFRNVLTAWCLSRWIIFAAASTQQIEQELNYAAKIYASIADANCENDEEKFNNFYQNVRRSVQQEGKFEHYFPDKAYCMVDCGTFELFQGKVSTISFKECCSHSQDFSVYLTSGLCIPCSDGYAPFHPYRDRINAIEKTTVTCQGDIIYEGLKQEDFTWCIYQLSNDGYDVHGCLNSSGIIEISSAAEAINLLDIVWIDGKTHAESNQGILSIINYNGLLDQALITCSVNNRNMSAIQFIDIDLYSDSNVFYAGSTLPPLPQVVRVGDVIEDFHCVFSTRRSVGIKYSWVHKNRSDIFECTQNCTLPMDERNSSRVEYYVDTEILSSEENSLSSCQFKLADKFLLKVVHFAIHEITVNDTGEYYCQASHLRVEDGQKADLPRSKVEKITVVLYEFPEEEEKLVSIGTDDSVACGVKTYSSANVSWWSSMEIPIPIVEDDVLFSEGSGAPYCSEQSDVFSTRTITEQENGFALFLVVLHFCNLNSTHLGQYSCVVDDEAFDSDIRNTTFSFTLAGNTDTTVNTIVPEETEVFPVMVIVCVCGGALLFLLVLVVIVITLVSFKKFSDQREYYRKCSLNSTSTIESAQSKLFFLFKQAESDSWLYPRNKLDYIKELGEGRFGRVYKAYAEGVTPTAPDKCLVAVKTTKELNVTQAAELWEELQLMKGLKPHPNICNMLAYCITPEGMPAIIVEYAAHRNLKDILVQCQLALKKTEKGVVKLLSDMEFQRRSKTLPPIAASEEKAGDHKAALLFSPKEALVDGLPLQNYALSPQAILESDIYRMASQIVAGLRHLEEQKILHRDISARNVLVAEGFIIKISDFGFARDVSQTEYYRKLADGLIPIKWVALEGLEKQIYTSKSDVWSFGVLLWEIASYGKVPYHGMNVSEDWDRFLKLLRSGYRLPQPAGCSNRLYNVMTLCWSQDPERRPSFSNLTHSFRDLLKPSKPPVIKTNSCQETIV